MTGKDLEDFIRRNRTENPLGMAQDPALATNPLASGPHGARPSNFNIYEAPERGGKPINSSQPGAVRAAPNLFGKGPTPPPQGPPPRDFNIPPSANAPALGNNTFRPQQVPQLGPQGAYAGPPPAMAPTAPPGPPQAPPPGRPPFQPGYALSPTGLGNVPIPRNTPIPRRG